MNVARSLRFLPILLAAAGSVSAARWKESDFPPRPMIAHPYVLSQEGAKLSTVIGTSTSYTIEKGDTLHDVARHLGLGINEVQDAFPDVDVWLPPAGETLRFPTWWVLPEADNQGIVVNIPEMRLYYFPAHRNGAPTVITYPVGLGRDEWQTPTGRFKISEKTVDPTWVIPESIRVERIHDKGRFEKMIAGGHPDNPLGRYRLRLTLPLYGIHGTNIPWGVGMQVSHGCVRLYPEDIERLFPAIAVGAPGEFVYEPVKIGAREGRIYIEVHRAIYDGGFDYWNETRAILADKGWENLVEWGEVASAIDRKSGVPTRISTGEPLLRHEAQDDLSQARGESEGSRGRARD